MLAFFAQSRTVLSCAGRGDHVPVYTNLGYREYNVANSGQYVHPLFLKGNLSMSVHLELLTDYVTANSGCKRPWERIKRRVREVIQVPVIPSSVRLYHTQSSGA